MQIVEGLLLLRSSMKRHPIQLVSRHKLLLLLFLGGLGISAFFLFKFLRGYPANAYMTSSSSLELSIGLIVVAVVFQLLGHCIRAYKSGLLIAPIKPASFTTLLSSLGIGLLFNVILPFRIGELIRAHFLGTRLHISRTVVFLTILFERAVDGIILSITIALLFTPANALYQIPFSQTIDSILVALIVFAALTFFGLYTLYTEQPWFLNAVFRTSKLLNDRLKNKIRFIAWSGMYGIHTVYRHARLGRYVLLSVLMWTAYLISLSTLMYALLPTLPALKHLLLSTSGYISVSIPSGPAFIGTFHYYFSTIATDIVTRTEPMVLLSTATWSLLILPVTLIGSVFVILQLVRKKTDAATTLEVTYTNPYANKLFRYDDISNELSQFLETYFKQTRVTHVLNKQEVAGDLTLVKTFKGGSNATTVLVHRNGKRHIRKIALLEDASKLEAQHDWIKEREHLSHIPKVMYTEKNEQSFSLDIQFEEQYIPFFDYIHSQDIEKSKSILKNVIAFVNNEIYVKRDPVTSRQHLEEYIQTKVYNKVNDCLALHHDLASVIDSPTLVINGKTYDNFAVIVKKITSNEQIMSSLATYEHTTIHGDLTIDNIIVNDEHFLLLDPNNENAISDAVVDYAKLYQSLHSGYEFLCLLEKADRRGNAISFEENISSRYTELYQFLTQEIQQVVTPERYRQILFHEAVHYTRMLTYRAKINPDSFLAFFAIAVRLFNDYYAQYDDTSSNTAA